jgi:hypothetical protein
MNSIAGDNRINALEAAAGLTISGTAEPDAGVAVSVSSLESTLSKTSTSDGTWSVALSSAETSGFQDGSVKVKATATDRAGNAKVVSRSVSKDTQIARPTISVIASDDVISAAEAQTTVAVSGTSEPRSKLTLQFGPIARITTATSTGSWLIGLTAANLSTVPPGQLQARVTAVDVAGMPLLRRPEP